MKICPEKYSCGELHNLSKHLSNYSLNKLNFKEHPEESIMTEDEFANILGQLGIPLSPIKERIQEIVSSMVRVGSETMEQINGCFELLGFDILLDAGLNPWVLEINMSPACSERAEWMTEMLDQMTKKMFQLVLPSSIYSAEVNELVTDRYAATQLRYNWEPIIEEERFECRGQLLPELMASRLNLTR